jgi:hypothetical protein
MIVETKTLATKAELQTEIQKLRYSKANIYKSIEKKSLTEIVSQGSKNLKITVIILEH